MSQILESKSTTSEFFDGRLFVLRNGFALDGRISAYPEAARGHAVSNCYLLVNDNGALLLDTGAAIFEQQILAQLEDLIDRDTPLSLFPLRINEFMSVGNAAAIAERFNVVGCYAQLPDVHDWLDFRAKDASASPSRPIVPTLALRDHPLRIATDDANGLEAILAPIRLISTFWVFDDSTGTLFSSDMFCHTWHDDKDGPWIMTNQDDHVTTTAFVRSFLLNTRYWWLEGAALETIRLGVADVFNRLDIQMIAPAFGALLKGRDAVERQFAVLDTVLREADRSVVKPAYIPRGQQR
ncbi:MAG: hypothetical protein ACR2PA_22605 [Hyphomicrobiaceae bacterium]